MAKELVLLGEPNPKQVAFFEATAPHIAYGGARGGGKSWAMRRKFVLLALNYDGLRLLLLRRTFAELEGNHIIPLMEELRGVVQYNTEKRMFRFPNGSFIKLGYGCVGIPQIMRRESIGKNVFLLSLARTSLSQPPFCILPCCCNQVH